MTVGNLIIGILGSLLGLSIYWTFRDWYAARLAKKEFREFVSWYLKRIISSAGAIEYDRIADELLNVRRPSTLSTAGFFSQFGPLLVQNHKYVTDSEYSWLLKFNKALKRHASNVDLYNDQWVNSMARSNKMRCLKVMYFLLVKIHILEMTMSMISEKLLKEFKVCAPRHLTNYNDHLIHQLEGFEEEIHETVERRRVYYIWRYKDSKLNSSENGAAA